MDKEKIQEILDSVNKEFNKNQCGLYATIYSLETMLIVIEIEWGDWKHEHGYADYVMSKNGFIKVKEQITEEDGDDCYSSNHYYLHKSILPN